MSVEKASATSTRKRYEVLNEIMVRGIRFPRYLTPGIKPRQNPKCDAGDALAFAGFDRRWLWYEELDDYQRELKKLKNKERTNESK